MMSAAIVPTRESQRQPRRLNKGHGKLTMAFLQSELAGHIRHHARAGQCRARRADLRFALTNAYAYSRDGVWRILGDGGNPQTAADRCIRWRESGAAAARRPQKLDTLAP